MKNEAKLAQHWENMGDALVREGASKAASAYYRAGYHAAKAGDTQGTIRCLQKRDASLHVGAPT
jgi:hypothetical protein